MKRHILTLAMITLPFFSIAQSKISLETSAGNLLIGKDRGENVEIGVNYHLSEKTAIKLSGLGAQLKNKPTDTNYQALKFSLFAEQTVSASDNISLGVLMGFSYLSIEDELVLDKNGFTGLDLGLNIIFNPDHAFSIGVKLVTTYAYDAPGGILQSNAVVRYRF